MFFRVPKKHRKMYPKRDENGAKSDSRRVPKIDPEKSNKAPHVRDRVWVPSGAPFWMVFGTFFGTFFDDFWVHFSIFSGGLLVVCSRLSGTLLGHFGR